MPFSLRIVGYCFLKRDEADYFGAFFWLLATGSLFSSSPYKNPGILQSPDVTLVLAVMQPSS
jgi:hypothetical protein